MCGIAGFFSFGSKRPSKIELENLFLGIIDRGKDASGIAWIEGGKLKVYKNAVTCDILMKDPIWKKLTIPHSMIMHTRQGTGGPASKNENNHPLFSKEGMAIIHNGVLQNEKEVYKDLNIKPDAEVDSELLLHLIKKWWKGIDNINKVRGTYACAVLNEKKPNEMILFRHSNPICYYMDKNRDILFFASTKAALKEAFSTSFRGFRISSVNTYELPDDTAIHITKDGVVDSAELKQAPYVSSYCGGYNNYSNFHDFDNYSRMDEIRKRRMQTQQQLGYNSGNNVLEKCPICKQYDYLSKTQYGRICKDCYTAEVVDTTMTKTIIGKGECDVCKKKDEELHNTVLGNICLQCDIYWLTEEYECPWCNLDLTRNDLDKGLCPHCNNEIEEIKDAKNQLEFEEHTKEFLEKGLSGIC